MSLQIVWCALAALLIGSAALFASPATPVAYACKCASPGTTPDDALARAQVVFVGRVISIDRGDDRRAIRARVEVVDSRKGDAFGEVEIRTTRSDSCGFEMNPDGVYLLHSSWVGRHQIGTAACIGNQVLSEGVRPTPFTLPVRRGDPRPLDEAAWDLFAPLLAIFGVLGGVAIAFWMTAPSARRRS